MTIPKHGLRNQLVAIFIICFCGVCVFGQGLFFDFINYDDPVILLENQTVTKGLSWSGVKWAFTQTGVLNLWAPMTYLSHMLDVSLFGTKSAMGHHGVSILLHIIATLALYLVLLKLFSNIWLATIVSVFWMVHPQRMESVMWVSERKDVLSGAFALWAWWCWEKGRESTTRIRLWLVISTLLFVLASFSKPSVIPLPIVLLVRECFFGSTITRHLIVKKIIMLLPMIVVSLLVALLTIYFQQQGGLADISGVLPLDRRLALMPVGFHWYISNLFFPYPGHFFNYPPQAITSLLAYSLAWLGALAVFIKFFFRDCRFVLFGLIVSVLFWLPVSGIVSVSYYYVADRYSYLIHIGLLVTLASVFKLVWLKFLFEKKWVLILIVGVSLGFAFLGFKRASHWKNSKTLFTREMQNNPRSLLAPLQLGMWYENKGEFEVALSLYKKGGKIDEESGLALTKQGGVYLKLEYHKKAMECYSKATKAGRLYKPEPYQRLAIYFDQEGDRHRALRILLEGLKRFPESEFILIQLGLLYHAEAEMGRALHYHQRALNINPTNPDALQGKAASLIAQGKKEEGIEVLQALILLYPEREVAVKFLRSLRD